MAVVVVGGHARNIGKTSVIAGLIARLSALNWTAFKITQHDHGLSTIDNVPYDSHAGDRILAISVETEPSSGSDTARFLAAGAARSLLVRVQQGRLAEAMPRICEEIAASRNTIFESNSILEFLQPDLYLAVLDAAAADFKDSARLYLDRADAVLLRSTQIEPRWTGISTELLAGKPQFVIRPPDYVTDEVAEFVQSKLAQKNQPPVR